MTARFRALLVVCALAFLAVHLWSLPRALEDPDSINFALSVESFDVSKHQPHPPGYPVYVALAKASSTLVNGLFPEWDRDRRAAVGLSLLSAVFGAIGALVLVHFWTTVGLPLGLAWLSALLTVASPLFWITSARPLTDVVGLVSALVVQTWLLRGWRQVREGTSHLPHVWIIAAIGVGLVVGVRSQTMWLIGPLAAWCVGELLWRRRWSQAGVFVVLAAAGVLAWFVPLVTLSGGLRGYLVTLGAQGSEDFAGVEMLATIPTLDMLKFALNRTFLVPWQTPLLGQAVSMLALVGLIRMVRANPGVVAALCLGFWPYVVFHLTFQETLYTRYALPIVVPIAGLAVIGLAGLVRRFVTIAVVGLAAVCVWLALPDARAYATEIAPLSHVVRDMIAARATSTGSPMLTMHHPLWWSSRRTLDWYRPIWNVGPQPFPGDREWLKVANHFRQGSEEPAWMLADASRSDVVLIDPRAQTIRGRYSRRESLQRLIGGDLLENTTWIEFSPPGWMLGRGWALTPEVAGATAQDRRKPNHLPADAWLRRAGDAHRLMIGGRYLGGGRPAAVVLSIDGRQVARWVVEPAPVWWVRWLDLPAGALEGDGPYATLTVAVEAADGGAARPDLGLEQFDFAPAGDLMYAFGDGWQELEENPNSGLSWRWSSEKNSFAVYGGRRDVELTLSGESPLHYFDVPPTVRVTAGGEEVGRFEPTGDFTQSIQIPARLLSAQPATVTVESNRVWVPAERSNSPDRRHLALRLYRAELRER